MRISVPRVWVPWIVGIGLVVVTALVVLKASSTQLSDGDKGYLIMLAAIGLVGLLLWAFVHVILAYVAAAAYIWLAIRWL